MCVFYMFYYNQNSGKYPAKVNYGYIPIILEGIGGMGVIYELIMSDHEEFDIVEVKNLLNEGNLHQKRYARDTEDNYSRPDSFTTMDNFLGDLDQDHTPQLIEKENDRGSLAS